VREPGSVTVRNRWGQIKSQAIRGWRRALPWEGLLEAFLPMTTVQASVRKGLCDEKENRPKLREVLQPSHDDGRGTAI